MRLLAPLLLSGILLAPSSPARVTIDINPRAVLEDGAIRLTCHVPRDPHNRKLEYGVRDYVGSQRDLDGDSQVTWQTFIDHVPCDVGPAYCAVLGDNGRWAVATAVLQVAGCRDM